MANSEKMSRLLMVNGAQVPRFVYGTAWKKERTSELVVKALRAGFTGIDTACQPKHYREDLVGEGIRRAIEEGTVKRESLHVRISAFNIGSGVCSATSDWAPMI